MRYNVHILTTADLTKETLYDLYMVQRISPEKIAEQYGTSGRSMRDIMERFGIPRLGPAHLRKDKTATWNVGLKRSDEVKEKISRSKLGQIPPNKGKGRLLFACCVCGNEVFEKPYRKKLVCSLKCKNTLMSLLRGEEHWNYKEIVKSPEQRQRLWAISREWRLAVLARDKQTCLRCGASQPRMVAHHLNCWHAFPEQRFIVANGATLCGSCHLKFHNTCGQRNTTKEMFDAWLTTSKLPPSSSSPN